jgi:hypothetical protein
MSPQPTVKAGLPFGRVLTYLSLFALIVVLCSVALVQFTVRTEFTAEEVRLWLLAAAPAVAGLGTLAAAAVAVVAIRAQQQSALAALQTQAETTAAQLTQQRVMATEERLWTRRIEFYKELLSLVRDPDAGRRDPSGDFEQSEVSDIVAQLANVQRPALADKEPEALAFASDAVVQAYEAHLSFCGWVQENESRQPGNYLAESITDGFFQTKKALEAAIRKELAQSA